MSRKVRQSLNVVVATILSVLVVMDVTASSAFAIEGDRSTGLDERFVTTNAAYISDLTYLICLHRTLSTGRSGNTIYLQTNCASIGGTSHAILSFQVTSDASLKMDLVEDTAPLLHAFSEVERLRGFAADALNDAIKSTKGSKNTSDDSTPRANTVIRDAAIDGLGYAAKSTINSFSGVAIARTITAYYWYQQGYRAAVTAPGTSDAVSDVGATAAQPTISATEANRRVFAAYRDAYRPCGVESDYRAVLDAAQTAYKLADTAELQAQALRHIGRIRAAQHRWSDAELDFENAHLLYPEDAGQRYLNDLKIRATPRPELVSALEIIMSGQPLTNDPGDLSFATSFNSAELSWLVDGAAAHSGRVMNLPVEDWFFFCPDSPLQHKAVLVPGAPKSPSEGSVDYFNQHVLSGSRKITRLREAGSE